MKQAVTALRRVGRNVRRLDAALAFYAGILGFKPDGLVTEDIVLAHLLGVERIRVLRLRRGGQEIELSECWPQNIAESVVPAANDLAFQHIALVTTDIAAASRQVMRNGAAAISRHGPVHLPAAAGGVVAFKFRDPEGHPLEFLQFPAGAGRPAAGFDHSAISVADVTRSVLFYGEIGVRWAAQQVNHGPEQDALDGLRDVSVDVVALRPPQPAPHVELLGYREPKAPARAAYGPGDVYADRLVFGTVTGEVKLLRDPDGHVVLIDGRCRKQLFF